MGHTTACSMDRVRIRIRFRVRVRGRYWVRIKVRVRVRCRVGVEVWSWLSPWNTQRGAPCIYLFSVGYTMVYDHHRG